MIKKLLLKKKLIKENLTTPKSPNPSSDMLCSSILACIGLGYPFRLITLNNPHPITPTIKLLMK